MESTENKSITECFKVYCHALLKVSKIYCHTLMKVQMYNFLCRGERRHSYVGK